MNFVTPTKVSSSIADGALQQARIWDEQIEFIRAIRAIRWQPSAHGTDKPNQRMPRMPRIFVIEQRAVAAFVNAVDANASGSLIVSSNHGRIDGAQPVFRPHEPLRMPRVWRGGGLPAAVKETAGVQGATFGS